MKRCAGFVILLHLPNSHGHHDVERALVEAMAHLPRTLLRTLTWEQGQEMAKYLAIAEATELEIFFCDPAPTVAAPDQREASTGRCASTSPRAPPCPVPP